MAGRKDSEKEKAGKISGTDTTTMIAPSNPGSTHMGTVNAGLSDTAVQTVTFTVNGKVCYVQVEPHWTLRDVLRQKLSLISVKDFCGGYGACGSCSVNMDGNPVLSCMILASECDGAVIETAEGIADANHPLIDAYIMNYAAQCGYCTPGFLVTAKALLDHNPNPTVDEIKEELSGNLCRCGTYPAHIKAILEAAKKLRGEV